MRVTYKLTLLSTVLILVAAACSDDDASSETVAATTVASTPAATDAPSTATTAVTPTTQGVLVTPLPADITETLTISDLRYSIDYPTGWFTRSEGSFTYIAQTEEQLLGQFDPVPPPAVAMDIGFDFRTVTFLRTIGLTAEDPTAQDLLEFNIRNFEWTDVRDVGEVEIFGTTAVVARVTDPDGGVAIQYMGVFPDGVLSDTSPDPGGEALIFIFWFGAPTAEEVDAFLPAWETMIESITVTE